jgi:acyl CoA:acetate/3-ketoacid CoA transferase
MEITRLSLNAYSATTPEYLILELYHQYSTRGHPKNIFMTHDSVPAIPGKALDKRCRCACSVTKL